MNAPDQISHTSPKLFISRELSWLDFNSRVLDEARTPANPLLERLKFIAIFSSNLDEFFMIRVAGLRQLVKMGKDLPDPAGLRPSEQLRKLRRRLEKLLKVQLDTLRGELLPALAGHGVSLVDFSGLSGVERSELGGYFRDQVLPVLTPLAVDSAHPFPILNSGAIEIAVSMRPGDGRKLVHAFVEVPEVLPRFVRIPGGEGRRYILLEELIMGNLETLFSGCAIKEYLPFRITRDMDFSVEDGADDDLLVNIEKKLLQRRHREPIRVELGVPPGALPKLAGWLHREFLLDDEFWYRINGPLHLKQLFELVAKAGMPELQEPQWPPVLPGGFAPDEKICDSIAARGPLLVAVPFHSFDVITRFIEEAADDPEVLAIKQTLYRVSGNSPVVRALRRAAENGKQVTVVVELKARFDENNNIIWARLLEESGAHVVYGVTGYKVHCKALLVVRREEGAIRRYVHLGTGNYNDKTAALYTDLGIMSCDPELCFDVANLFNVLTGYSSPPEHWRKIAASPFDLRKRIEQLILREIELNTPERPGRILAKMNSLSDEKIVRLLHRAADAGVRIDLIVRGICCFRPRPGQDNVRIVSIVDRYLEHSRVYCFGGGGDGEAEMEMYLSSADMMYRNLDRRFELLFPVEAAAVREKIVRLLEFQLRDSDKCRRLIAPGVYTRNLAAAYTASRSQRNSYEFFKEDSANFKSSANAEAFKVHSTAPRRLSEGEDAPAGGGRR